MLFAADDGGVEVLLVALDDPEAEGDLLAAGFAFGPDRQLLRAG